MIRQTSIRTPLRARMVRRIRLLLEKKGYPKVQMFFLIAVAAASAFLASYMLLHAGITAMWMRYPLALSVAYLLFLSLLWIWIKTRPEHHDITPDLINLLPMRRPTEAGAAAAETGSGSASVGQIVAGAFSGELALPVGIVLFALTLIFSSLYIVYSAPFLFAEILADTLLATALYRRLQTSHWLETAVRHTIRPYLLTFLAVAATGYLLGSLEPGAVTLGDLLQ